MKEASKPSQSGVFPASGSRKSRPKGAAPYPSVTPVEPGSHLAEAIPLLPRFQIRVLSGIYLQLPGDTHPDQGDRPVWIRPKVPRSPVFGCGRKKREGIHAVHQPGPADQHPPLFPSGPGPPLPSTRQGCVILSWSSRPFPPSIPSETTLPDGVSANPIRLRDSLWSMTISGTYSIIKPNPVYPKSPLFSTDCVLRLYWSQPMFRGIMGAKGRRETDAIIHNRTDRRKRLAGMVAIVAVPTP